MQKTVLVADDNTALLKSLKEGIELYCPDTSVVLARNGIEAIKVLEKINVSIVVTDIKMPDMDGLALLAHMIGKYPDIPVIIITAYNTPEIKRAVEDSGHATDLITKPFVITDLANKIEEILKKNSDGGIIQAITPGIFLQLIEMEQKTCTVRIEDNVSGRYGVLFFRDGDLLEARVKNLLGKKAALEIFSWDKVTISIENDCPIEEKKINGSMQALLMEATHKKDEREAKPTETAVPSPDKTNNHSDDLYSRIREKLTESGFNNIFKGFIHDGPWKSSISQFSFLSDFIDTGTLRMAYVNTEKSEGDLLILNGPESTVLLFRENSPKEDIIRLMSNI